jgi:hypothetical protein
LQSDEKLFFLLRLSLPLCFQKHPASNWQLWSTGTHWKHSKCIHWVLMLENTQWKNASMHQLGASLIGSQWRLLGSFQWILSPKSFHCTQSMEWPAMDASGSIVHGKFAGAGSRICAVQPLLNVRWMCCIRTLLPVFSLCTGPECDISWFSVHNFFWFPGPCKAHTIIIWHYFPVPTMDTSLLVSKHWLPSCRASNHPWGAPWHCQKTWLGWLHPSKYWMEPSEANLVAWQLSDPFIRFKIGEGFATLNCTCYQPREFYPLVDVQLM